MASHRKPRTRILASTAPRAAVGVTAAALASVTLMSESASAAPAEKPSIAEVKQQIDTLNQQAEVATQQYDQAKEKTDTARGKANQLLAQVAQKTQQMNDTRRVLGQFAAAQYRNGGLDQTSQLLLSSNPQQYLEQAGMLDKLSSTQQQALRTFQVQQEQAGIQRAAATTSLNELSSAQAQLATQKKNVQTKLSQAQHLLATLTAAQKAKLASLRPASSSTSQVSYTYSGPASGRAAAAVKFALAQIGKPYVFGATGPGSYDCSGLTQAAYAAAGITIGRTTWDQDKDGVAVSTSALRPGDLVFYYSGLSHVGMYIGDGKIVHAPHPGASVEIAPVGEMPIAAARRIA